MTLNEIRKMVDLKKSMKDYMKENYDNELKIYTNYNDEMSAESASEIFDSDNPWGAFDEWMLDTYEYSAMALQDDVYEDMKKNVITRLSKNYDEEELLEVWDKNEDELRQLYDDTVDVKYPYDKYLNQRFNCNVLIDNGDSDYDFGVNQYLFDDDIMEDYKNKGYMDEELDTASLFWLVEEQGHSKKELIDFLSCKYKYYSKINDIRHGYVHTDFLSTVGQELLNMNGELNALVFLQSYTLKELIQMAEAKASHKKYTLLMKKDVMCGLFDEWNGGGSDLGIMLEKDQPVPSNKIFKVAIDEIEHYGVSDVYGMSDDAWTEGTLIKEEP